MSLGHQTLRNGFDGIPSYSSPSQTNVKIALSVEEISDRIPASWHRMVVFSDPIDATTRAVITLYRTAVQAAGNPAKAQLYVRRVGQCHFLYFSPEASLLCERIFEVFPAEPIEHPPDLHRCSRTNTGLLEIRARDRESVVVR